MCEMYNRIEKLCDARGIKPGKLCADLGISRGIMSDLKAGRTKRLSAENISRVSSYFSVSTDYLLTGEESKKKPTQKGRREIGFDDFTYAMNHETKDLTEADRQILLSLARQLNEARKQRNERKAD